MKKYLIAAAVALITAGAIFLSAISYPIGAAAQVTGNLWTIQSNYLTPVISTWGVKLPSLTSKSCLGTNSSGEIITGTCGGGGGTGLSTSTPLSAGNLLVYSATGKGYAFGVATSTLTAGTGLTGSFTHVGSTGSLSISNTGVTAGTYGSASAIPYFTVNAQGQLTSAATTTFAVAGSKTYYNYATQATSSPAYFNMNPTATTTATTKSYVLANGTNYVQNWITPVGDPGVSVIPAGSYIADLYAWRSSGSASILLSFQVWEVSSTGADVALIATSNSTANLTGTSAQYQVAVTAPVHAMASVNDRIVMRLVAVTTGTPTLSITMGNGSPMDFVTPGATVDTSNFVPYTGATKAVDLGSYGLTGATLTANTSSALGTVTSGTWNGSVIGSSYGGAGTVSGILKANGAGTVSAAVNGTDYTLLTTTTCTSGQFVSALTAAGGVTCTTPASGGSVAGSATQIQYNNYGAFGATADFAYSTSTGQLLIGGTTYHGPASIKLAADLGPPQNYQTLQANTLSGGATLTLPSNTGTLIGTGDTGTVTNTMLANSTIGLTSSGSITVGTSPISLGGSSTLNLNLAHANTWTALQTFGNASTTQLSAASNNFYVNSAGKITGYDTVHSWSGVVSPTRAFSVGLATSTAWLATSTSPYNLNAQMVLPFTGTLRQAVCNTNAGTLTVQLTIAGVSHYITGVAVTPATTTFSGVTFGEGAKFSMNAGNPASSPQSVTCTLYATQTP